MIHRLTLGALLDARFPDDYSEQDETRDFRRVLLETVEGRRVLARLMERAGWHGVTQPVQLGQEVPHLSVFNEGKRSIAVMIATILERDPSKKADDGGPEPD